MTTARQVLDLGVETSRHFPHPVRLRGMVTYAEPGSAMIYVQDETAGIRVVYTSTDYRPVSGQLVTVEGTVAAGTFAPFVNRSGVRVEGTAPIPEPCETPATRLAAASCPVNGCKWKAWSRPREGSDRAQLFVSSGGLRFHAVIQPFARHALPTEWLDARGDAARRLLDGGGCGEQAHRIYALCPRDKSTVSHSIRKSRSVPASRRGQLSSQPELRRQSDVRVKVAGVVAFHSLSGHLYLHDGRGPVRVRLLVRWRATIPRRNTWNAGRW